MAAAFPVYFPRGHLRGVVAVDMSIEELMADVTYFQQGQVAYSFIIDRTGRALFHPLLPTPFRSHDRAAHDFFDITSLEPGEDVKPIIASMRR